jgi:hypothetical protein
VLLVLVRVAGARACWSLPSPPHPGLSILKDLLVRIEGTDVAQTFYAAFFISLIRDVFAVLSDTLHKTGFKLQVGS